MEKELGEDPRWRTRRTEAEEAYQIALEAHQIALQLQNTRYAKWGKKWAEQAASLIASFEFFLSGDPIPSGYRFAGWINHPAFLLRDMKKTIASFEATLEPSEKPTQETQQLALF